MKKRFLTGMLWLAATIAASAQTSDLKAVWNDGLKFISGDGRYRSEVGGRVHYDASISEQATALDSLVGKTTDNIEVRRARLSFAGSINNALAYEFEFTFGETLEYADMYFAFLRVPYFERLTVGHFREPFGMEELTSSNTIVFMERSLTSAFGPSRNTGFMLQRKFLQDKLRGYAGVFRITDDLGADLEGEGKHSFSSRWVYNPVLDTAGNRAVHIGAALNAFKPQNGVYELKSSNETSLGPNYISTGSLEGINRVSQIGGEFGFSRNKFVLQSEYIASLAQQKGTTGGKSIRNNRSYYVMGSYFLKGGRRRYSASGNRFSSISLTEQYEKGSLSGAWELGLRFSRLAVEEGETGIDRLSNATLGLNWYVNSNSRIMMNYILSKMNLGYWADAIQFRIQLTF